MTGSIDLDRLLKLRLLVARFGEMDLSEELNMRLDVLCIGFALRRGVYWKLSLPSGVAVKSAHEHARPEERGDLFASISKDDDGKKYDCESNENWQTFWSGVGYVGGAVGGGSGLSAGGLWKSEDGKRNAAVVAGVAALIGGLGALIQNRVATIGVSHGCTQLPPNPASPTESVH